MAEFSKVLGQVVYSNWAETAGEIKRLPKCNKNRPASPRNYPYGL